MCACADEGADEGNCDSNIHVSMSMCSLTYVSECLCESLVRECRTFAYVRSTCMHLRIYDIQKQTHRQRHPYPHPATLPHSTHPPTHTCTQYRANLEKRLEKLYTVRNPTKIPDALSVSEEVHLCVCVSSLCVCFIFERVFNLWASVSSSHFGCLRERQCLRVFQSTVFQSTRVQTPFPCLKRWMRAEIFGWRFGMYTYIHTHIHLHVDPCTQNEWLWDINIY